MRRTLAALAILTALLIPSSPGRAQTVVGPLVAYTLGYNVFLMDLAGNPAFTVTNRGTGYQGTYYPWYAWSPDGQYLLMVRFDTHQDLGTLLLLNHTGQTIRTLATFPSTGDFWPSWAIDGNQIAVPVHATLNRSNNILTVDVSRVDLAGHISHLFTYRSLLGCGGGTPDPAQQAYWSQVGYEGHAPTMSWSIKQGLAVYSSSCRGGINITNLRTLRTVRYSYWDDPALSPDGILAVMGHPRPRFVDTILDVNPRTGTVMHQVARGELPFWRPDGRLLFFVQRTPSLPISSTDSSGRAVSLPAYNSAILDTYRNGSHLTQLATESAYAFGPLSLTLDGRTFVFASLSNQRQLGGAPDAIWIQRLQLGGQPVNMLQGNRPVVQP